MERPDIFLAIRLAGTKKGHPVDQMVLKAQQWVNATYTGISGYNPCTENGMTGWETIYCLTRALQHELGITTLSDNFGPTTWADLNAYGPVGRDSANINMRTIAEAALYCKGYSGGDIDGGFNVDTGSGLTALVADMGLQVPPADSQIYDVDPKVFKALLTMDAYVITAAWAPTRSGPASSGSTTRTTRRASSSSDRATGTSPAMSSRPWYWASSTRWA